MFKLSRSTRVLILVILLHILLLAFLFLEWHLHLSRQRDQAQHSQQQEQQDEDMGPVFDENDAPIVFVEEPPVEESSTPSQQAPPPAPPVQEEQDLHEIITETPEEPTQQPAIIAQPQSRRNGKQAWFKKQPQQQQQDTIRTVTVPSRDYFKFEHADETRTGSSSLHEKIKKQFADNARNRYLGRIMQALCYEINKKNIIVSDDELPHELIFRIIIERSGKIRDIQFITQSTNPEITKNLKEALWAASPLESIPVSVKEDYLTLNPYISSDYSGRVTHIKHPLRIYIKDRS